MITNEESFQDPQKFYHPDNWSIESSELVFLQDSYLPIIRVKGLRFFSLVQKNNTHIVPTTRPEVVIKGQTFLAPAVVPYYHVVTDILAQFHYVRKYFPETNIVFCSNQLWKEGDIPRYMEDILQKYADSIVLDTVNGNIFFEEVLLFPNECLWQSDRPVPYQIQKDLCQFSQIEVIDEHINWMNNLKDILAYDRTPTPGKKIYATRIPRHPKQKRERWNTEYYLKEKQARLYPDEYILEEYFANKGFEIVDVNEMTMFEQIEKFKDAEIVVGIKGTNIFNAVWMDRVQTVVMLYTTKFWNYEFERYFRDFKCIEVKPESWHAIAWEDTETKTPVQDLIDEYERLAELNGF